jgi:hypothetical protein
MRVGAKRHRGVGVAEAAGDDVDGDAGLEQESGVDVPQVVEPDPGEGSGALRAANYIDSEACRTEFFAFHTRAVALSVPGLILPVVPISTTLLSPESTDELVRIVGAIQYRNIESALLDGYDSPAWLRQMASMADDLISALAKSEEILVSSLSTPPTPTASVDGQEAVPDEDGYGLIELVSDIESKIDRMTASTEEFSGAMTELGAVSSEFAPPKQNTPKAFTA